MPSGPPRGIERRRHPRYDLLAQVRVKHAQVDYVMELDNISLSGARLHLGSLKRPNWLAIERAIDIGIVHPEELDTIDVQGRVVRIEEDAAGTTIAVCFVDPPAQGIARLIALARHAPPPLPK